MASIGRFAFAGVSTAVEVTNALASVNIDFSLVKIDPPHEFRDVGEILAPKRRNTGRGWPPPHHGPTTRRHLRGHSATNPAADQVVRPPRLRDCEGLGQGVASQQRHLFSTGRDRRREHLGRGYLWVRRHPGSSACLHACTDVDWARGHVDMGRAAQLSADEARGRV